MRDLWLLKMLLARSLPPELMSWRKMNVCLWSEPRCGMMVDFVLWKGMVLFSVSMDEIGFCLLGAVSFGVAERGESFWWSFGLGDELLVLLH